MNNKKITIDFEKMYKDVIAYFSNLSTDMMIAYAVLAVGLVALIISFCI